MSAFCIDEHIHRFGLWTAARAASKSLLSNDEVKTVAERIGLREELECLRMDAVLSGANYVVWLKGEVTNFRKKPAKWNTSLRRGIIEWKYTFLKYFSKFKTYL